MPPETSSPEPEYREHRQKNGKNENDEWQKLLLALLFLLISFGCILCSSHSALWLINREYIEGDMLSDRRADYGPDSSSIEIAPLSEDIIDEAARDETALSSDQPLIGAGIPIAVLPNPLPTPLPQPTPVPPTLTPVPTFTPTPTPTPTPSDSSQPTSAPPPTQPPQPTEEPTSAPTQAPTQPPPTQPPPTVPPPTSPPPTSPPPTSPPPTSPPPTSPPPTSPPPTSPPPPVVSFSAAGFSVNEGDGNATITVVLNTSSAQTVTVEYTTSDGTATAGSDYSATSGTLTFSPGQISRTFDVPIIDDALANEPDETVQLSLSNPNNATLGTPNPATLTILDNDPQPTVDFESDTYFVNEDEGPAVITVTLSTASAQTVTVDYATDPGGSTTASIGSDYIATSGTLTFTSGITGQIFNVEIIDDAGSEITETVALTLSNAINANLGAANNPALLNIVDDEDPGDPPCGDNVVGTVEIGPPDCQFTFVQSDVITVDLTASGAISITGDGNLDFDLVYYERESLTPAEIALDRVQVEVTQSITWYTVFDWGDGNLDTNTNIGQAGYGGPGENDDTPIPMTNPPLYQSSSGGPITGIAIDVDAPLSAAGAPPGLYRYVRVTGYILAEVDSIEVLPP